jgi:hypothetical protein
MLKRKLHSSTGDGILDGRPEHRTDIHTLSTSMIGYADKGKINSTHHECANLIFN